METPGWKRDYPLDKPARLVYPLFLPKIVYLHHQPPHPVIRLLFSFPGT